MYKSLDSSDGLLMSNRSSFNIPTSDWSVKIYK